MKEKIEDTKGIINSRKLQKDREYNGHLKMVKKTSSDGQHFAQ